MDNKLQAKLQNFDKKLLEFERKYIELSWRCFHGENVANQLGQTKFEKSAFIEKSGYMKTLEENLRSSSGTDRREFQVRRNSLLLESIQLHPSVIAAMQMAGQLQYDFRVIVGDYALSEGQVAEILATSPDPALREIVWRAQEQSLVLAPIKLGLVQMLNDASSAICSLPSYAHVVLGAQDMDPVGLSSMILDFEKKTRPVNEAFVKKIQEFAKVPMLAPTDVNFFVSNYLSSVNGDVLPKDGDKALALFKRTLYAMGFTDVHEKKYLDPESLDRPPYYFSLKGGIGYAPEECAMWPGADAEDFRAFVNPELSPTGIDFTRTVFLESGRVLHYQALNRLDTRRAFKWDSECMRDALAMVFDSITEDPKWLRDIGGLELKQAEALADLLAMKKLSMARRMAADALFELRLYNGEDPCRIYREVQELFTGFKIDYEVENRWAWHPYLAYSPARQPSYILGYIVFRMISDEMRSLFGGSLLHPKAAEHLVDKYYTGYEKPWSERLPKTL